MRCYFVSRNLVKYQELRKLCKREGITLVHAVTEIREPQLNDFEAIVIDKVVQGFRQVRSNVIVDHSGIQLDCLGGLPGGLTQLFWDTLEDGIVKIAERLKNNRATVVTALAFCDGRNIYKKIKTVRGRIVKPKGARKFKLDRIFVPNKSTKTFASMKVDEKNKVSQRAAALYSLVKDLRGRKILKSQT